MAMRYIAVEEHFGSPGFFAGPGVTFKNQVMRSGLAGERIIAQLSDMGPDRIKGMDAAGIDVQLLSLNYPGTEQSDATEGIALATEANDHLLKAIEANPRRLAGLATLPIAAPEQAALELTRRVKEQGFKGAIINGHHRGRYLDDPFFWPIFEAAESLGAPIYLHPTIPPKAVVDAQYSGFTPGVNFLFAGPAWGWHIETGSHVIRLILGGVFDRFPNLQVVVGHMGEGLPFMLPRLDQFLTQAATKLKKPVSGYLRENVHYTFGSFNFTATFLNVLMEIGIDRILFSVDYPYGSMSEARAFLEGLPISPADKERIAHVNAERLFKL